MVGDWTASSWVTLARVLEVGQTRLSRSLLSWPRRGDQREEVKDAREEQSKRRNRERSQVAREPESARSKEPSIPKRCETERYRERQTERERAQAPQFLSLSLTFLASKLQRVLEVVQRRAAGRQIGEFTSEKLLRGKQVPKATGMR